jgi:hypothetical protein
MAKEAFRLLLFVPEEINMQKKRETYGVEILQEAFVDMSVSFTVICHPSPPRKEAHHLLLLSWFFSAGPL